MEFFRSLRSLCKASVFNSDDDDDDDSTCCRRCDELELFAIRDVVVLDFVVDDVELLLSTCVFYKLLHRLNVTNDNDDSSMTEFRIEVIDRLVPKGQCYDISLNWSNDIQRFWYKMR